MNGTRCGPMGLVADRLRFFSEDGNSFLFGLRPRKARSNDGNAVGTQEDVAFSSDGTEKRESARAPDLTPEASQDNDHEALDAGTFLVTLDGTSPAA